MTAPFMRDVTAQCDYGNPDDEALPLTKCVCGAQFKPWEFVLNIYMDDAHECPKCGRKLVFRNNIHIFEVVTP